VLAGTAERILLLELPGLAVAEDCLTLASTRYLVGLTTALDEDRLAVGKSNASLGLPLLDRRSCLNDRSLRRGRSKFVAGILGAARILRGLVHNRDGGIDSRLSAGHANTQVLLVVPLAED